MLQQTQVATVIPYYERFLKRFPTAKKLAVAPLEDVLKLWAGLGYYSRARNLHRAAQMIVARFGGRVPATVESIRELPGIGAYTAGAILSIAYGKPEAVVDGNVARVLSRIGLIHGDYRRGEPKRRIWAAARELVENAATQKINPGDLNQALMELGATVCTPQAPDCTQCPVTAFCHARKKGVQESYPEAARRRAVPVWWLRAWLVHDRRGRVLFAQRQPHGLFGGLWELPTERITRGTGEGFAVTHVLSHRMLGVAIRNCGMNGDERWKNPARFACWSGSYQRFRWLTPAVALRGAISLSSLQKKLLTLTT